MLSIFPQIRFSALDASDFAIKQRGDAVHFAPKNFSEGI